MRTYPVKENHIHMYKFLDDTAEFFFNGVSSRQSAPRLYCDICDQFDIHDTEDCPKQVFVHFYSRMVPQWCAQVFVC